MSFVDLVREPAIHVRFRGYLKIRTSEDGASFVVEGLGGQPLPIGPHAPEFEDANARLADGAPLGRLRDAVLSAGGAAGRAASYVLWLQRLCRWGFIEFPLMDDAGERAAILPQQTSFAPSLAPESPAADAGLDRFACLRRDGGAWLLESPLTAARLRFGDLAALDAPVVRRALDAAGFLDTAPRDDERRTALAQWEFHDLLLHFHHRVGWHFDLNGASFPFIDEIEPLPATRPEWPGERIPLARVPNDAGQEPFASVLERRRSERFYDESRPISLRDLGALLDRAARIRSFENVQVENFAGRSSPFEITRRPYPNGGASYELEIYPVVDRCDGLESGLYHYDAAGHALVRISGRTPETGRIFADAKVSTAGLADPQIVLAIAARFARVMWKYRSISYGVILRNAGALYQTLYLAATELGLSPCGIGAGDSATFARATGLDPVVEGTVGDFILGGPPRPS